VCLQTFVDVAARSTASEPEEYDMLRMTKTKKAVASGAVVLAGLGAGALLMPDTASAATDAVSGTVKKVDPTKSQRSDEHLLTGTTASKVKAAALAKYPSATVQRVETDSDGVYEAHVVNAGQELIVQVGKDFAVTGTQTGGGHGDGDGDGPSSSPTE
jgi:hypothetical protein